jgi:hypothetical protein
MDMFKPKRYKTHYRKPISDNFTGYIFFRISYPHGHTPQPVGLNPFDKCCKESTGGFGYAYHEFFRISRQYIVQRRAIRKVESETSGRWLLHLQPENTSVVIVSKRRVPDFRLWMEDQLK